MPVARLPASVTRSPVTVKTAPTVGKVNSRRLKRTGGGEADHYGHVVADVHPTGRPASFAPSPYGQASHHTQAREEAPSSHAPREQRDVQPGAISQHQESESQWRHTRLSARQLHHQTPLPRRRRSLWEGLNSGAVTSRIGVAARRRTSSTVLAASTLWIHGPRLTSQVAAHHLTALMPGLDPGAVPN